MMVHFSVYLCAPLGKSWTMEMFSHYRAGQDIVIYTLKSVYYGIYLGDIGMMPFPGLISEIPS